MHKIIVPVPISISKTAKEPEGKHRLEPYFNFWGRKFFNHQSKLLTNIFMNINQKGFANIVLIVLVVISVVQAVQLNSLKDKIESGSLKTASVTTTPLTGGDSSVDVPSNIEELPQMVGGC